MFDIDDKVSEGELNNVFAYLLEHENKSVVYLADYYKFPKKTLDMIKNVDVLIADGTYLFTDEYKKIKHNHIHGEGVLKSIANINAKNIYFHSISHLTGYTHEKMQKTLPESYNISYDGMDINLE